MFSITQQGGVYGSFVAAAVTMLIILGIALGIILPLTAFKSPQDAAKSTKAQRFFNFDALCIETLLRVIYAIGAFVILAWGIGLLLCGQIAEFVLGVVAGSFVWRAACEVLMLFVRLCKNIAENNRLMGGTAQLVADAVEEGEYGDVSGMVRALAQGAASLGKACGKLIAACARWFWIHSKLFFAAVCKQLQKISAAARGGIEKTRKAASLGAQMKKFGKSVGDDEKPLSTKAEACAAKQSDAAAEEKTSVEEAVQADIKMPDAPKAEPADGRREAKTEQTDIIDKLQRLGALLSERARPLLAAAGAKAKQVGEAVREGAKRLCLALGGGVRRVSVWANKSVQRFTAAYAAQRKQQMTVEKPLAEENHPDIGGEAVIFNKDAQPAVVANAAAQLFKDYEA